MKSNKILGISSLILIVILILGCSITKNIYYDTDNITPKPNPTLATYTLDVQIFEDIRKESWSNVIVYGEKDIYIDRKPYCINAEKHYDNGTVNLQISELIYKHLKRKEYFKDVSFNKKESADYYVTGKIETFMGKREQSDTAKTTNLVGTQFGPIGVLTSNLLFSAMKTPGEIDIVFKDITIYDKSGEKLYIGEVSEKVVKDMKPDGWCWSIYSIVNEHLQIAVEKLSIEIEMTLNRHIKEKKRI